MPQENHVPAPPVKLVFRTTKPLFPFRITNLIFRTPYTGFRYISPLFFTHKPPFRHRMVTKPLPAGPEAVALRRKPPSARGSGRSSPGPFLGQGPFRFFLDPSCGPLANRAPSLENLHLSLPLGSRPNAGAALSFTRLPGSHGYGLASPHTPAGDLGRPRERPRTGALVCETPSPIGRSPTDRTIERHLPARSPSFTPLFLCFSPFRPTNPVLFSTLRTAPPPYRPFAGLPFFPPTLSSPPPYSDSGAFPSPLRSTPPPNGARYRMPLEHLASARRFWPPSPSPFPLPPPLPSPFSVPSPSHLPLSKTGLFLGPPRRGSSLRPPPTLSPTRALAVQRWGSRGAQHIPPPPKRSIAPFFSRGAKGRKKRTPRSKPGGFSSPPAPEEGREMG